MSCRLPVLCCLALFTTVLAITIDEYEVIVRGPPPQHAIDTDDLFGYSAALHNLVDPVANGSDFESITRSARILVGVPNGTTANYRVDRTGYVLECPLTPGTCTPLRGSGNGNDTLLYDETSNEADEDKMEQFLGVAMESRNGSFAVCGHRWKSRGFNSGANRYVQGKCLVSGRLLRDFRVVLPCTQGANDQLLPGEDAVNRYYGYCLSGTDMSFLDDGSLAIGAPGYHTWNGAGFVYSGSGMAPVTGPTGDSLVSYGGMAVRQARITNLDRADWLMSAPRANKLYGEVHVFIPDVSDVLSGDQSGTQFSKPVFTLTGGQIGASFGYSLGGVDFDGDGFDDVLVGAPLFFKGSSLPEVGAVYVYENTVTNNIGSLDNSQMTVLTAPGGGVAYSRFGHAIAPLGDLDDDGFDDVAISAPFGQGLSGTVYIYRGSRQGIVMTPAQTLVGSELNLMPSTLAGLTSFGAYLSGGTDIDGNQYNDLIIGAFMSRKVFVMRSRSVVTVVGVVKPLSTSVTLGNQRSCPLDQSANHCFQVQYCLSINGKRFREDQHIATNYTLYADKRTSGLQPRAIFSSGSAVVSGQTSLLLNSNDSWCNDFILYIQTTNSQELVAPLRPAMDVSVPQGDLPSQSDGNQELTDLTKNRIYVRTDGVFSAQVAGNKECLRALCSVDAYIKGNPVKYISHLDPAFKDDVLLVGVVSDIVFSTTIGNTGPETAYNVQLVFTHPASLTFSRVEDGAQFMCETDSTARQTVCSTPNGLGGGTELKVPFRFVIDDRQFDASVNEIMVSVEIQVEDDDSNSANNVHTYQIPVRLTVSPAVFIRLSDDELPIVANVSRSGLPKATDQIGRGVNVTVTITNDGPSAIGQGRLTVYLPYRTPCTRNAFLLYLHSIHHPNMQCTVSPHGAVDTLQLTHSDRSVQHGIENSNRDVSLDDIVGNCSATGTSTAHIICDANIPGCATIVCLVNAHRKGSVHSVRVSGYLDDFFYKNAQTSYKLFFRAVYEELLANNSTAASTGSASDIVNLLVKKSDVMVGGATVEAWLIVVPIVISIAFIAGLIGFLWICGFFKRKRSWKTENECDLDNEGDNHCDRESARGDTDCDRDSDTDNDDNGSHCGKEFEGDNESGETSEGVKDMQDIALE